MYLFHAYIDKDVGPNVLVAVVPEDYYEETSGLKDYFEEKEREEIEETLNSVSESGELMEAIYETSSKSVKEIIEGLEATGKFKRSKEFDKFMRS